MTSVDNEAYIMHTLCVFDFLSKNYLWTDKIAAIDSTPRGPLNYTCLVAIAKKFLHCRITPFSHCDVYLHAKNQGEKNWSLTDYETKGRLSNIFRAVHEFYQRYFDPWFYQLLTDRLASLHTTSTLWVK